MAVTVVTRSGCRPVQPPLKSASSSVSAENGAIVSKPVTSSTESPSRASSSASPLAAKYPSPS
jgi:hypothetical protein